jgi:hypothetical protein
LIWRERGDHPDFPVFVAIIGFTNRLQAHSFDSRGVYRVVETRISEERGSSTCRGSSPTQRSPRAMPVLRAIRRDVCGRGQHDHRTLSAVTRRRELGDDLATTYRRVSGRTE